MGHRQDWVWDVADRQGHGLEIGPLDAGLAPKRYGFDVKIMDYLDTDSLRKRFAATARRVDLIEEVDFIFDGRPMDEVVGRDTYDYIVGAHLVEHTPDLIGFFQGAEAALRDHGVLCVVVPDMRYTFDYFDFPTALSEIWRAHQLHEPRPNYVSIYQHHANHARMDGRNCWDRDSQGPIEMSRSEDIALRAASKAEDSEEYVDVHVWSFVPASLRLLIRDLRRLGFTGLTEVAYGETIGCEFFLALGKGYDEQPHDRMALLSAARRQLLGLE